KKMRAADRAILALHYGSAVVHVREIKGEFAGSPIMIGTYGFSASGSPAALPVLPYRSKQISDDAA
ncbi:MAG: hypothetical protein AAFR73_13295, partial [Pseudomonadota bacterium]